MIPEAKADVDMSFDLPWDIICGIACKALVLNKTFNEALVSAIEVGLEKRKKLTAVTGKRK